MNKEKLITVLIDVVGSCVNNTDWLVKQFHTFKHIDSKSFLEVNRFISQLYLNRIIYCYLKKSLKLTSILLSLNLAIDISASFTRNKFFILFTAKYKTNK